MNDAQAALPLLDEVPPGLAFLPDLISRDEESVLIEQIDDLELPPFVFQRWTSRRRTRSFGYVYDFAAGHFATAEPIPHFLFSLKARAANFAGIADHALVQASLIRYEPGAGIGWHRDRAELGTVIGVSLGASAMMRFRQRSSGTTRRAARILPPRSAYHLAGEARDAWEHSIPPVRGLRWSVTFRALSAAGAARLRQAPATRTT